MDQSPKHSELATQIIALTQQIAENTEWMQELEAENLTVAIENLE